MISQSTGDSLMPAERVLDVLDKYRLDVPKNSTDRTSEGRAFFKQIVEAAVKSDETIHMVLPAFPFKSPNSKDKTLGRLPDKAEELSLAHLESTLR